MELFRKKFRKSMETRPGNGVGGTETFEEWTDRFADGSGASRQRIKV